MTGIEKINAQIEYTSRMKERYIERADMCPKGSASCREYEQSIKYCEGVIEGLKKALEYIEQEGA
jgi:hypothetical protein